MWFKNLQMYRLPKHWPMAADQLGSLLAPQSFTPCTSSELLRQGWEEPRPGCGLVYTVNKQYLLQLRTEKKLLPTSVINQVAKAKAVEMEEAQGFAPGRKAMKELKERVADELLPRAFSILSATSVWIDPVNGWLVVDAASPGKADEVVKLLLKAVDRMPLESLRVNRSPTAVMTAWLETDEAPAGFTVDQDATMRATGESKATVSYKKHTLEPDDLRRHIAAGKQCTRLAMTWNDKISFVLDESLAIKSIKALDVIKESDMSTRNDEERFDNDMMLMTGELAAMLADLVAALGGEAEPEQNVPAPARPAVDSPILPDASPGEKHYPPHPGADEPFYDPPAKDPTPPVKFPGNPSEPDDLYGMAVTIVRANQRASISLVQRHLRIGYNRAARLLEQMEAKGVVSPMASNGNREVMPAPGETA